MADEQLNSVTGEGTNETEFDPISAIKDMKANMVNKSDYEKVLSERNKYLKALVNGTNDEKKEEKPKASIEELEQKIYGKNLDGKTSYKSSAEMLMAMCDLRDALMEQRGYDPGAGEHDPSIKTTWMYTPKDEDLEGSQEVVDYIRSCYEAAEGDPEMFHAYFKKGLK